MTINPLPDRQRPIQIPPDVPEIPTMLDRDEKFLVPIIVGAIVLMALGLLILVATML